MGGIAKIYKYGKGVAAIDWSGVRKNKTMEEIKMEYSIEELLESKRQIDSTLHKLRETVKTFEAKENVTRYKSQITLATRRIKAFEIANELIEREIAKE